jgi:hypothetical protein
MDAKISGEQAYPNFNVEMNEVRSYLITLCHNPGHHNMNTHHRENPPVL